MQVSPQIEAAGKNRGVVHEYARVFNHGAISADCLTIPATQNPSSCGICAVFINHYKTVKYWQKRIGTDAFLKLIFFDRVAAIILGNSIYTEQLHNKY